MFHSILTDKNFTIKETFLGIKTITAKENYDTQAEKK
jgi:hypothetical protein